MIDTLRLNLIDAEIKKTTPLRVQPPILDYSTGKLINNNDLFIDNHGKIITGAKAFLNDSYFNLTINPSFISEQNDETGRSRLKQKRFKRIDSTLQPDLYDYNYREEDQVQGIFVQTSLPRLINQNNFKSLTLDQEVRALEILESKLKSYGITTDLKKANLSRLDTFTNITTQFDFFSYSNLFSLMECTRQKQVSWNDESFLWRNKQQELMVYDKIRELTFKDPELRVGKNRNIMRVENRLLRKRKIATALKLNTVEELLDNYQKVKDFHKNEVGKKIFKYSISDINGLTENKLEAQLIFCKKQFGSKWLDGFLKMEGMRAFLGSGTEDYLLNIIDRLDSDKKKVALRVKKSRLKKMFNEMKFYIGMFEKNYGSDKFKSNVDLYNEIKTKFYKEVA